MFVTPSPKQDSVISASLLFCPVDIKKKAEVVTVWPEPVFSLTDFAPAIEVRDRKRVLTSVGTLGWSMKGGSKEKKVGACDPPVNQQQHLQQYR